MRHMARLIRSARALQQALQEQTGRPKEFLWPDNDSCKRLSFSASALEESLSSNSAEGQRVQLIMLGSYTVSRGSPALRAAAERAPHGTIADSPVSGRQLYMDEGSVTSEAGQTSTSSSEEGSEQESSEVGELKKRLLGAALKHVKEKGWSVEAIQQAAKELQLSPAAAGIFTRPQAELVEYFVEKCNEELVTKLAKHASDLEGLRPSERIQAAIKWRLEMLIPYIDTWPQALAIHTSPGSLPTALRQVGQLVNEIWYAAGDKSADFNWYTKRAALAGVYMSTEVYMLTDYSPGYADTWEALDRRLQDVATVGRFTGKAREAAKDALKSMASTLQWAQDKFQASSQRPL